MLCVFHKTVLLFFTLTQFIVHSRIMAKKQLIEADIWVRRNAAHNDFWNVYDSFKKNLSETKKKHILAYYGKSGVGKTVLLHQLMKEMSEKISNSIYTLI